jgi:Arabinose-binding domain of AraC transcription regulator, N-term
MCVRPDEAESAELRYEIQTPRPALARQSFDLMLAGGHLILTLLGGESYRLDAVHLPHKPVAPPSVYWRYFGVKVRFERPTASLVVSRALFDAPLPRADETLRGLATSFLESNFDRTRMSVLPRVRLELRKSLGSRTQASRPSPTGSRCTRERCSATSPTKARPSSRFARRWPARPRCATSARAACRCRR